MKTVIQVKDRDAIPVRALPWLTDWWFGAQEVAEALTQDKENYPEFSWMQAYRLRGEFVEPVSGREWRNTVVYAIDNIIDKGLPADQWRCAATAALPADVFVWRDEWELAYTKSPDGPDSLAAMGDPSDSQDIEDRTLNFAPDIPQDLVRLVMDVFTQREAQTPAPGVADDPPATPKNQRQDLLAPLIEQAQRNETDPFNAAVIWPKLCVMAELTKYPLIGISEDGIKWTDASDNIKFLTKKALGDRLRRLKRPR